MKRIAIVTGIAVISLSLGGLYWFGQSRSVANDGMVAMSSQVAPTVVNAKVFRTPTCGCCGSWMDHAEAHGFVLEDQQQEDLTPIKEQYGITPELASCHTAIADGYVFEGHIPAEEVKKFLAAPPADVVGLAVPGMPIGSPGMEMGDKTQPYEVLAVHRDGSTSVFASYE
jgi:hypothetical protein